MIATSLNAYSAFWQELAELQPNQVGESQNANNKERQNFNYESWNQLGKVFEKTKEIQVSILNDGKSWKYSQSKESMVCNTPYLFENMCVFIIKRVRYTDCNYIMIIFYRYEVRGTI